ncbi:hypothetical protein PN498_16180 [Oscillatoria sp. CS-180]|uniref:hypothetical protein n=1 Tax=Oscillatoria sp. CS-180 TaxID=3021720 RepID=UPI0023309D95|nr:hypothetical protein [Oscillatoria sp. CS-180]MDB9527537.1 hypothetical protein [Oscillatoria sp. CS-180]
MQLSRRCLTWPPCPPNLGSEVEVPQNWGIWGQMQDADVLDPQSQTPAYERVPVLVYS